MNDLCDHEKYGHLPRAISEVEVGREPMKSATWCTGRQVLMSRSTAGMTDNLSLRPALSSLERSSTEVETLKVPETAKVTMELVKKKESHGDHRAATENLK
jgi:hypothetical protein